MGLKSTCTGLCSGLIKYSLRWAHLTILYHQFPKKKKKDIMFSRYQQYLEFLQTNLFTLAMVANTKQTKYVTIFFFFINHWMDDLNWNVRFSIVDFECSELSTYSAASHYCGYSAHFLFSAFYIDSLSVCRVPYQYFKQFLLIISLSFLATYNQ